MITVIEVFKSMGLEPSPDVTWPVGAAVRDRFLKRYGRLPSKELRPKTSGHGSHCFAVYPDDWRPLIVDIIKKARATKAAQSDLFGGAA